MFRTKPQLFDTHDLSMWADICLIYYRDEYISRELKERLFEATTTTEAEQFRVKTELLGSMQKCFEMISQQANQLNILDLKQTYATLIDYVWMMHQENLKEEKVGQEYRDLLGPLASNQSKEPAGKSGDQAEKEAAEASSSSTSSSETSGSSSSSEDEDEVEQEQPTEKGYLKTLDLASEAVVRKTLASLVEVYSVSKAALTLPDLVIIVKGLPILAELETPESIEMTADLKYRLKVALKKHSPHGMVDSLRTEVEKVRVPAVRGAFLRILK